MSRKTVFVVFGRDEGARDDLYSFIRAVGLSAMTWEHAVSLATGSRSTHQIVRVGIESADVVIVLFTPDEIAELRPELGGDGSRRIQPRPNVLLEAGWAFGAYASKTIIVEAGMVHDVSDLGGVNTVRMRDAASLNALASRLEALGCAIDRKDAEWSNVTQYPRLFASVTRAQMRNYWEASLHSDARPLWLEIFRAANGTRAPIYISAGDLFFMGQLLEDIKSDPKCRNAVGRVCVKSMAQQTFEHLRSVQPPLVAEELFQKLEANLGSLRRCYGEDNVRVATWLGLPRFTGAMYGEVLMYHPWQVDDHGRLSHKGPMKFIRPAHDRELFDDYRDALVRGF